MMNNKPIAMSNTTGVKRQRHQFFSSDDDSDSDSASETKNPSQSSTQSVQYSTQSTKSSSSHFPKYIVIEALNKDKPITKTGPFLINQTIKSIAGTVTSIKNLKNGTLLVECKNKQQTLNLLSKTVFCGQEVKVFPHKTFNYSKGIVRCHEISDEPLDSLKTEMSKEGVTDIKRINIKRNGKEIKTNTYIFTFNTPKLPERVRIAYLYKNVEMYVPNPLRCFRCQEYGHHEDACPAQSISCGRCSVVGHRFKDCKAKTPKCTNCKQEHFSGSRTCEIWKKEKEILKIKHSEEISLFQARAIYEERNKINEQTKSTSSYANIAKSKSVEIELCRLLADKVCELIPDKAAEVKQLLQSLTNTSALTPTPSPSTTQTLIEKERKTPNTHIQTNATKTKQTQNVQKQNSTVKTPQQKPASQQDSARKPAPSASKQPVGSAGNQPVPGTSKKPVPGAGKESVSTKGRRRSPSDNSFAVLAEDALDGMECENTPPHQGRRHRSLSPVLPPNT